MKAFDLTQEPIDTEAWRGRLFDKTCGGYAAFEGWVRDHNEGHEVVRLEYEVYDALARSEGLKILSEAVERFGVTRAACVHRYGGLELGDVAVWVGVAAAHRDEAFKACRYIIDEEWPVQRQGRVPDQEGLGVQGRLGVDVYQVVGGVAVDDSGQGVETGGGEAFRFDLLRVGVELLQTETVGETAGGIDGQA